MSDLEDEPRTKPDDEARRRDHLRVVEAPARHGAVEGGGAVARPRTIGRLIAQTALIADSAASRREVEDLERGPRRGAARLLGRFR